MKQIYITGNTQASGQLLVGGLFTMMDTFGFPLDLSILTLRDSGTHTPDWLDYLADAEVQDKLPVAAERLKENAPADYDLIAVMYAFSRDRHSAEHILCRKKLRQPL